jgi:hypothetical protein
LHEVAGARAVVMVVVMVATEVVEMEGGRTDALLNGSCRHQLESNQRSTPMVVPVMVPVLAMFVVVEVASVGLAVVVGGTIIIGVAPLRLHLSATFGKEMCDAGSGVAVVWVA